MKKRLITLFLAVAMLTALVSGCSSSGSAESPASTKSTEEASALSDQATQAVASDDGQAPVKPEAYTLPLFEQTAELSIFYPTRTGNYPPKAEGNNVFWATLQKNLNVSIAWSEPGQTVASEQFNLMIASGDMSDIISESMLAMSGSAYTGGYDAAIDEGIYTDLTDHVAEWAPNYYYLIKSDPEIYKNVVTDQGRIASFCTLMSEAKATAMGAVINSDYLEATGLEAPDTVDGWMELFAAMKANGVEYACDANENGALLNGLFANALGANIGNSFLIDVNSGDLIYGPTTDQTRAYIELFRECLQKGYIDPDFTSVNGMDFSYFRNGTVATSACMGNALDTYYDMYGVNVTPCPVVRGEGCEAGQTLIGDISSKKVSDMPGLAITTNCEDLESAMKMCDWLYSDAGFVAANYGWTEGETYEIKDGKYMVTDFYNSKWNNTDINVKSIYTLDGDAGYVYPNMDYDVGSDTLKKACELWTSDSSNAKAIYYTLPTGVKLTSEENEEIASKLADLDTYEDSAVFKWLTCTEELNDDTWNEFVAQCQSMGLEELNEVYTTAYERYDSK